MVKINIFAVMAVCGLPSLPSATALVARQAGGPPAGWSVGTASVSSTHSLTSTNRPCLEPDTKS